MKSGAHCPCGEMFHPQPGYNELDSSLMNKLLMNKPDNSENVTTEIPWCVAVCFYMEAYPVHLELTVPKVKT